MFTITVRSESSCALGLRYVDFVVSIEVAVEACCCFTVFICQTAVEVQYRESVWLFIPVFTHYGEWKSLPTPFYKCTATFRMHCIKVKISPWHTCTYASIQERRQCISNTFVTSGLGEGGWLAPRPGRFTPDTYPIPIVQEDESASGAGLNRQGKCRQ
jgi:hypothetical protein